MPWEPLHRPEREPKSISEPLDELLTKLSGVSRSAIDVVMDHWSDIVGDPGWWGELAGQGRVIDTRTTRVIGFDWLGGWGGSTSGSEPVTYPVE